jgi:cardiolipin synthase A/B
MRNKLMSTTIKFLSVIFLVFIQIKLSEIQYKGNTDSIIFFNGAIEILKAIIVLHIIYKLQSPSYKMLWIILIMFFPLPGLLLYVFFGSTKISNSFQSKIDKEYSDFKKYIDYDKKTCEEIKNINLIRYNQVNYLYNTNSLPLYKNSHTEYFDIGEKYFESMIIDISKAKNYVFVEYYSITEGIMWNRLFELLKQKVLEGVKVYIIVDAVNDFEKLPKNFEIILDEVGIQYRIFNSNVLKINSYFNYRHHRKITVIDGNTTYTGGINIGDEYINIYEKFGHWKDVGIKTIGKPTLSYIIMFIEMWNLSSKDKNLDYQSFVDTNIKDEKMTNGYIMPYFDGPDNSSNLAKNLYIQIINTAKEYVYITTPYLILDNEIITSLVNSAKSGVDVRIITPYIPDKKFVHLTSQSFYQILLESGVKIYEYKPGFIHSKVFVTDDELVTVGTINLDFRGLYSHFECGNWIYKTGIELEVKNDFLKTQDVSLKIKLDDWKTRSLFKRLLDKILMTLSPLI